MNDQAFEKIALLLKTDENIIKSLEEKAERLSGKSGVLQKIVGQNKELIERSLSVLGLAPRASLKEIVDKLENKVAQDEQELSRMFGPMDFMNPEYGEKLIQFVQSVVNPKQGLFLKTQKAKEFLKNQPPQNVLKFLGYRSVDEMLDREDLFEVYASLRFGEEREWLNTVFFKQYETLSPDDFEIRPIIARVLDDRFTLLAQEFVQKKYHNLSHLKELGLVFIIPTKFNQAGQLMKVFSLLFHYFYEVQFYADLFEQYSADAQNFSKKIISLLRGDVPEPAIDLSSPRWLVVQRYLEKEDQYGLLLMVPHVNPESIHWTKAQRDISRLSENFSFWNDLDWVGDLFKDEIGAEVFVTFNLIDVAMILADKEIEQKKYVYHHREALWNKIFVEYFGWDMLEKSIKESILSGVIKL